MGALAWWRLERWRWHVLVPLTILPLLIAVGLLQLLGPVGGPLSPDELHLLKAELSREPFLAGVLTLVGLLAIHVCVCLCGIALAWGMLHRQKGKPRFLLFGALSAASVAVLLPLLSLWRDQQGAHVLTVYRVTYDFFDALYRGTGAEQALLQPRLWGVDALAWAVLIPTCIGIVGVGIVTAAAAAELRALPKPPPLPDPPYEARLQTVQGRLKRLLTVLTIGLVTSTVAVSIFFHLPSKLAEEGGRAVPGPPAAMVAALDKAGLDREAARIALLDKMAGKQAAEIAAVRAKLDDYAGELSVFWGAVFTLTLLAAGAVPLLLLQRRVRLYTENARDAAALEAAQKRLGDNGLLTGGMDQVKLIGAVVAPLASGPIASFVQAAVGS